MQRLWKNIPYNAESEADPGFFLSPTGSGGETLLVALASGILGIASALYFAQWQVSVESAQVLAGTVDYPYESSFYIYHMRCWTLLNQLPAIALYAGVSPSTASLVVAAVNGMLGFQALACIALALGANRALAVATPMLYVAIESVWEFATPVYPLRFIGVPHTYGTWAINWLLLAIALLGRGHLRTGWFMVALGPAIHLVIGCWGVLIAALGTAFDRSTLRTTLMIAWPWVLLAMACGLISFGWQHSLQQEFAELPPDLRERFVGITSSLGDTHRAVVPVVTPGVLLNLVFVVVTAFCLGPARGDLPARSQVLLASLAASAVFSMVACVLTRWQNALPEFFVRAMPGRFANVVILAYPAVLMGLGGAYWGRLATRVAWATGAVLLAAAVFNGYQAMVWTLMLGGMLFIAAGRMLSVAAVSALLEIFCVVCLLSVSVNYSAGPAAFLAVIFFGGGLYARRWSLKSHRKYVTLSLVLILLAGVFGVRAIATNWNQGVQQLTPDVALRRAAEENGMLLTGADLYLAQVKTGRPVLFCGGAIDFLPYVPEAGPDAKQVLDEVYGIDLFAPPAEQHDMNGNNLLPHAGRALWQRRTEQEWREIRNKFQVTNVLVPQGWLLHLPLVAESRDLRLYRIP